MLHTCEFGRLFSRCHLPAVAVCQYCGRAFCNAHGDRFPNHDEVCARPVCQQKRADLLAHIEWKTKAVDRSNRGFCGIPDCDGERWGQCSKCHALFCERHLHDRNERIRTGTIVFSRPASMCDHCVARNKLWTKA
jgi:hypothetical protein